LFTFCSNSDIDGNEHLTAANDLQSMAHMKHEMPQCDSSMVTENKV